VSLATPRKYRQKWPQSASVPYNPRLRETFASRCLLSPPKVQATSMAIHLFFLSGTIPIKFRCFRFSPSFLPPPRKSFPTILAQYPLPFPFRRGNHANQTRNRFRYSIPLLLLCCVRDGRLPLPAYFALSVACQLFPSHRGTAFFFFLFFQTSYCGVIDSCSLELFRSIFIGPRREGNCGIACFFPPQALLSFSFSL